MFSQVIPILDKIHFFIYDILIKLSGHSDEMAFTNIYLLTALQFFSCILMSALIISPFFLTILFGYWIFERNLRNKQKNIEINDDIIQYNERIVQVTNETITNRFEKKKEKNEDNVLDENIEKESINSKKKIL